MYSLEGKGIPPVRIVAAAAFECLEKVLVECSPIRLHRKHWEPGWPWCCYRQRSRTTFLIVAEAVPLPHVPLPHVPLSKERRTIQELETRSLCASLYEYLRENFHVYRLVCRLENCRPKKSVSPRQTLVSATWAIKRELCREEMADWWPAMDGCAHGFWEAMRAE